MSVPMVGFSVAYMFDALAFGVCAVQNSRGRACQLLRQKLKEQQKECGLGSFSVPFSEDNIARQPSMPMVPLCD